MHNPLQRLRLSSGSDREHHRKVREDRPGVKRQDVATFAEPSRSWDVDTCSPLRLAIVASRRQDRRVRRLQGFASPKSRRKSRRQSCSCQCPPAEGDRAARMGAEGLDKHPETQREDYGTRDGGRSSETSSFDGWHGEGRGCARKQSGGAGDQDVGDEAAGDEAEARKSVSGGIRQGEQLFRQRSQHHCGAQAEGGGVQSSAAAAGQRSLQDRGSAGVEQAAGGRERSMGHRAGWAD
mmetsp:Transcript_30391/g.68698  ORF Transcript_30391/g.68698 Transcript_30391/m.68698 type:complete len:237 (-) Transcript_30391:310-1020(-)